MYLRMWSLYIELPSETEWKPSKPTNIKFIQVFYVSSYLPKYTGILPGYLTKSHLSERKWSVMPCEEFYIGELSETEWKRSKPSKIECNPLFSLLPIHRNTPDYYQSTQ